MSMNCFLKVMSTIESHMTSEQRTHGTYLKIKCHQQQHHQHLLQPKIKNESSLFLQGLKHKKRKFKSIFVNRKKATHIKRNPFEHPVTNFLNRCSYKFNNARNQKISSWSCSGLCNIILTFINLITVKTLIKCVKSNKTPNQYRLVLEGLKWICLIAIIASVSVTPIKATAIPNSKSNVDASNTLTVDGIMQREAFDSFFQYQTETPSIIQENEIKKKIKSDEAFNGGLDLFEAQESIFHKHYQQQSSHKQHRSKSAAKRSVSSDTTTTTTLAPDEECESKVLDIIPAAPLFDFTDITEDAARQFTEFLTTKFPDSVPQAQQVITDEIRDEVRRRANGIASYALNEDDNLLAFAIAAPSIHTVVVKFRDNVTIPPEQSHNKAFLGSYWRELGYAWNSTDSTPKWGAPFRDCNLLKGRWLWPFRISFTDSKIKIVAAAFTAADENVCNDELEEIFGRRHGCDRNTTFCLVTENKPLPPRDVYTCLCLEYHYLPNSTLQGFRGDIVEMSEGFDNYSCVRCPGSCTHCDQHGTCLLASPQETVSMENLLKVSVGSVLGACILCCIVLSVIVFRQRKCKAIASGMWTVLETILLGIIILYLSVAVHFFPASTERCLLEPWLRELGFITCYGAIILKLYRHLVEFRTRKAHRWVLRDVDLLKYLSTMVFAVICYMTAFTASSMDLLEAGHLESLREKRTNTCKPLKWEYVTQASEVIILCFGLNLSFATRNANTQFKERQFLAATLFLEFIISCTFYAMRYFYLPQMNPGTILLALFLRSQLTNTIALGLIFIPKLWYQHKQGSHDPGQRLGGGYAGLCLGDPDTGELTISEMNPEDIRAELKRLYTQLEILKNKTLRQDNPHISKRRGGRKPGHRRFSLQALSAKHRINKHHQDIEITEAEPSRTPEEYSVCSADLNAEISGISQSMLSHSVVSHSMVSQSK
ncbi:probable G-protein coupled receptor 158 isoform X2 [Teleopsis dalmanni]|uniref:probable G-protein coupled receptor 158 isoform X2 n=1 Tax=Teleopsis dalmanni TaxID=139649 RepID=UPI0018CC9848|nr:probable G-protein coupled receptor 158 isoform X2 [Teleopsis dalmanni]